MRFKLRIVAVTLASFIIFCNAPIALGMNPSNKVRGGSNQIFRHINSKDVQIDMGNCASDYTAETEKLRNTTWDILQNGANPQNMGKLEKCLRLCATYGKNIYINLIIYAVGIGLILEGITNENLSQSMCGAGTAAMSVVMICSSILKIFKECQK